MNRIACILLLSSALALTSWGEGRATTWIVAKDGSGNYSVIQDALDVCAAGDTVRIKPGRYDDFRVHTFQLGGTGAGIMIPMVAPLTVIGADQDSVFIGPEVMTTTYTGYDTGGIATDGVSGERIEVRGLTVENLEWPVTLRSPFTFVLCKFGAAHQAELALDNAPDVIVQDCLFEGTDLVGSMDGIRSFVGGNNPRFKLSNCTFRNLGQATLLTGSNGFEYSNLTFEGVGVALGFEYGSTGTVTDCRIGESDLQTWRIVADSGSRVTLDHVNVASSPGTLKLVDANTSVTGTHLHLGGGSYSTVYVATGASLTLHDCDILNAGGYSLFAHDLLDSGGNVDVQQCYWGTVDSLQVEEWIVDGKDDPGYKNVLFWPIRETPVPVKAESVGGLKALFHSAH